MQVENSVRVGLVSVSLVYALPYVLGYLEDYRRNYVVSIYILCILALCSPACTLTTDTCDGSTSPPTCKCGTSAACGSDTLTNRCVGGVCLCGSQAACTSGTRYAFCLDASGLTPASTNTLASCKVNKMIIVKKSKK